MPSVPGSTQFRLPANGTELENLFLTGDWMRCGLNGGGVEAAVTAGVLTAEAIGAAGRSIRGARDRTRAR